ncbi:hypothetical protein K1T71_000377 [Dendrolimus kikuchii]|uniref:Uncharacterized protein n=1 Tax=Dendrolimus kikuchii TaxID=765133 RepID=A0ACC1DJP8_9NEOP|nr:hypothetical protein K1T71_000377 [Dendrolimus kikuchii]
MFLLSTKMFKNFRSIARNIFLRRYCDCQLTGPPDPNTAFTILANGVRVATEVISSPFTCISMFVEAGPRFETACNNGITHMIEHMAYKGSFMSTMTQSELEYSVISMGGQLTVKTLREIQIFTAKCPAEYAPNVIDIFSRILLDLSIDDAKVEEEKRNICLEMIDTDNDPKAVLFDYLHQTAFQGTPLAQRVIGPSDTVQKFDASSICSFIQAHYRPYKLVIATAGGVPHDQMVRLTESKFGHMVGDPYCESNVGPCRFTGSQIIYRDDSMPFTYVAIAVEAPGYCSPDFLTMLIASCMIGSWDRTQGPHLGMPLAEAAAVAHLCVGYESFYIPYRDVGLWGIYFISKRMDAEDMLLNVQDQWMKLCIMSQASDFERGKFFARLKLAKRVEGVVNSCMDIGTQVMNTCGRKSLVDTINQFENIKLNNFKGVCEKYIYDRCPAVVALGPTEVLSDYTRIRAGMYWLRL